MSVRLLAALATALAFTAGPAPAADGKPDPSAAVLEVLFNQELQLEDPNVNDIPLFELLQKLTKRHAVNIVINEDSFKLEGRADIKEAKPTLAATQLRGMTLHQFLRTALEGMNATYLIRGGVVEIVTPAYAARAAKCPTTQDEDGRTRMLEPLVSAVIKDKSLADAAALLAERYDLNILVSPQAGEANKVVVSARLLNVPADKAIGVIALQSDLRVVRKGNTFLITSPQHASQLAEEKLEAQMKQIELERLRSAPPPKPQPEPRPKP